jgi:transcriptional regulator with XRE-family HTH domain
MTNKQDERRIVVIQAKAQEPRLVDEIAQLKAIGGRIKVVRTRKLKMDQTTLGNALGISANAVSLWERGGQMQVATEENLVKLADFAEVSLHWLKTGEGIPEKAEFAMRMAGLLTPDDQDECFDTLLFLIESKLQRTERNRSKKPKKN